MLMIRVLIVEDSPVAQEFLIHIFSSDPEIQVVGVAENGVEAIEMVRRTCPDVISMDIHMPIMDGFEATRKIMETSPVPIVVVSSSTREKELDSTFRAMEAGALAAITRPPGFGHPDHDTAVRELIKVIKTMSEIKVVRRIQKRVEGSRTQPPQIVSADIKAEPENVRAVVIGASTGGPPALKIILSGLPRNLAFPVLIVQHIARGFISGFAEWLSQSSAFPVRVASQREYPLPGCAYVAPDNLHMEIGADSRIVLSNHAPENGLRPSVSRLFLSVAQVYGMSAVGILLTGMGRDGVEELKIMKTKGAITIAQDKQSSIVYGMPGEAVKIDAAKYIMSPNGISEFLKILSDRINGGENGGHNGN
jgi:two-component system, chemotaxis family, protein-glutamate methylesterase/glutaminase